MPGEYLKGFPDPPNSPNEKFLLPSTPHLWQDDLYRDLINNGAPHELALAISRSIAQHEERKALTEQHQKRELEWWANVHTHPGGTEDGSGGMIPANRLLYVGGIQNAGEGTYLDEILVLDTAGNWTTYDTLDAGFSGLNKVCVRYHNYIYIFGGYNDFYPRDVRRFNVETGVTDIVSSFSDHESVGHFPIIFDGDHHVYKIGGGTQNSTPTSSFSGPSSYTREVWRFNLDTHTWEERAELNMAGYNAQCVRVGSFIYIYINQREGASENQTQTFQVYDIENDSWSFLNTPTASTFLANNFWQGVWFQSKIRMFMRDGSEVWSYDIGSDSWDTDFPATNLGNRMSNALFDQTIHAASGREIADRDWYRRWSNSEQEWEIMSSLPSARTEGALVPVYIPD